MFDATRLRQYRRDHQISAQSLADQLGVSRPYIHLIETGQRTPNPDIQRKIGLIFDGEEPVAEQQEGEEVGNVQQGSFLDSDEQEPRSNNSELVVPVSNLMGMVHGILVSIETMIRHLESDSYNYSISGETHEVNGTETAKFNLFVVTDSIVLSITSMVSKDCWLTSSNEYGRCPDLVVEHPKSRQPVRAIELVWFTGYASLYSRVRQCRRWQSEENQLTILDDKLQNLVLSNV